MPFGRIDVIILNIKTFKELIVVKWRMYSQKSEPYFRQQAIELYNNGKDIDYISNILKLESDMIWEWIKDDNKSDLYVNFSGVWRLVQSNYFCEDFQALANSISKTIKVILKKNKKEKTYKPKKVNK